MSEPLVSVVIPANNEELNIDKAVEALSNVFAEISTKFELIFVDDGSRDGTWGKIMLASERHACVRGVKLSRNWGKDSAIMAGLSRARGDCTAVIDCDLQHPPKILAQMVAVWREGKVDIVEGVKQNRGTESLLSKVCASLFYKVLEKLSGLKLKDSSDFRLLDKRVVQILLDMPEQHPFFRGMSSWVGFNVHKIFFNVEDRAQGQSSFTFYRSIKYAIKNITTFSSLPMQFVSLIGVLYFVFALLLGVQVLSVWASGRAVEGFTTSILLTLITGAMIMLGQGITGHYIARIYDEIKSRPRVIIAKDTPYGTSHESTPIASERKNHA